MKTKLACIVLAATILLVACEKNKFETIPQITVKSISPGTVVQDNVIKLLAGFTDKEGDLDSILIVTKWYDDVTVTRTLDTLRYGFDVFNLPPNIKQGDIAVEFIYGRLSDNYALLPGSPVSRDTTATLGLVIIDKEKNRSLFAESDKIRLKAP